MDNRIKELRVSRGWSMRELAARANTTGSTINKLEKGRTVLDVNWLERLGKALDVPIEELLRTPDHNTPSADLELFAPESTDSQRFNLSKGQILYKVLSDILDQIGIVAGDILVADSSKSELSGVQTGDIVIADLQLGNESILLLRQFIRPSLLISNSSAENAASLNLRRDNVGISAVVISSHSTFRTQRQHN